MIDYIDRERINKEKGDKMMIEDGRIIDKGEIIFLG